MNSIEITSSFISSQLTKFHTEQIDRNFKTTKYCILAILLVEKKKNRLEKSGCFPKGVMITSEVPHRSHTDLC